MKFLIFLSRSKRLSSERKIRIKETTMRRTLSFALFVREKKKKIYHLIR